MSIVWESENEALTRDWIASKNLPPTYQTKDYYTETIIALSIAGIIICAIAYKYRFQLTKAISSLAKYVFNKPGSFSHAQYYSYIMMILAFIVSLFLSFFVSRKVTNIISCTLFVSGFVIWAAEIKRQM